MSLVSDARPGGAVCTREKVILAGARGFALTTPPLKVSRDFF